MGKNRYMNRFVPALSKAVSVEGSQENPLSNDRSPRESNRESFRLSSESSRVPVLAPALVLPVACLGAFLLRRSRLCKEQQSRPAKSGGVPPCR